MASSILFSDEHPPIEDQFVGYAFIGPDYVYGETGALEYRRSRDRSIGGGNDGCYVSVRKNESSAIIDTDYAGFSPLFYYSQGKTWIVSNSFERLIHYMRARGLRVRPNYPVLSAVSRLTSLQQLISFETPAQNVRLLPLHHEIVVNDQEITVRPRTDEHMTPAGSSASTYEDAIHRGVAKWVQRMRTLIEAGHSNLRIDLSGGLDSRVVFSLYIAAHRAVEAQSGTAAAPPKIVSAPTAGDPIDVEIATELASHFGLNVNDPRRFPDTPLTPDQRYLSWRSRYLGSYYPIYVPSSQMRGDIIQFGGIGAENHRAFYQGLFGNVDPPAFVEKHTLRVDNDIFSSEFKANLTDCFKQISSGMNNRDAISEHYRQFRSRLHGGVHAQARVTFSPLSSREFDWARKLGGESRYDRAQMNYDVMSLVDEIFLTTRFDKVEKSPGPAVKEQLLSGGVRGGSHPGRVFGEFGQPDKLDAEASTPGHSLSKLFSDSIEEALRDDFVISIVPEPVIKAAKEELRYMQEHGKFSRPGSAVPVARLLVAKLVRP